jgi:putative alpha-1,2-mannosidase
MTDDDRHPRRRIERRSVLRGLGVAGAGTLFDLEGGRGDTANDARAGGTDGETGPVAYVDPFIGTDEANESGPLGSAEDAPESRAYDEASQNPTQDAKAHCFPGATLPRGMVQLSPDTAPDGSAGGYFFDDTFLKGFSHTHLSGTGRIDLGNVLVTATVGDVRTTPGPSASDPGADAGYRSRFSHGSETAEPGYYAVTLEEYGIEAELTATRRVGIHRYTFPASENAHVLVDVTEHLSDAPVEAAEVTFRDERTVTGSVTVADPFGTATSSPYTVHFAAEFSPTPESVGTWAGDTVRDDRSAEGTDVGAYADYTTEQDESVVVAVGISFVSQDNALENLRTEVPGRTFDAVRADARRTWNDALGRIDVEGGTPADRTTFYTALYHALLGPYTASDVNGEYRGMDDEVYVADDYTHHHLFSTWDTFRAVHPLLTIVAPEAAADCVRSLANMADHGGWVPRWQFVNRYTESTLADHGASVLAEAIVKDVADGLDAEAALEAMTRNATKGPYAPGQDRRSVVGRDSYLSPLEIVGDQARVRWQTADGATGELRAEFTDDYADGRWHHYAVTYRSDDTARLYVDGREVASTREDVGRLAASSAPWILGTDVPGDRSREALPGTVEAGAPGTTAAQTAHNEFFADLSPDDYHGFLGDLDEFAVHDRALSRGRVRALAAGKPASDALVRYAFDDVGGEIPNRAGDGPPAHPIGHPDLAPTDGVRGGAVSFNGMRDAVVVDGSAPAPTEELTVSFWVRTDAERVEFLGRPGLHQYETYGYVPASDSSGAQSVSETLEDAYVDWAIARAADAVGQDDRAGRFRERAGYYRNVFDPEEGFVRPRNADGSWTEPFDPTFGWDPAGFYEGSSWSWTWSVLHDVPGLVELMGRERFVTRLDAHFERLAAPQFVGQPYDHYWHGNEPGHHVPYLYNYAGQPWKTQRTVARIRDQLYDTTPGGIYGNEDMGQMSAWYVFSAMGLYPVAPARGTYDLAVPAFDRVTVDLPDGADGDSFDVRSRGVAAADGEPRYVASATLDGAPLEAPWLDHDDLTAGATLELELAASPTDWGTDPERDPPGMDGVPDGDHPLRASGSRTDDGTAFTAGQVDRVDLTVVTNRATTVRDRIPPGWAVVGGDPHTTYAEAGARYIEFDTTVTGDRLSYFVEAPEDPAATGADSFGPVEVSLDGRRWRQVRDTTAERVVVGADSDVDA